jgi:DNA-binding CsgD family transcriptional regulator
MLCQTQKDAVMAVRNRQLGFDLRALTVMIADANDDEPGPMLPWSLLDDLAALIPGHEVSICELDLVNQERELQQGVLEDDPRCLEKGDSQSVGYRPFWRHYDSFWQGVPPSRAGQVRRWTDRYPGRLLAEQPLYREAFQPFGVKYLLSVGLPAPAGRERNLLFWRHDGPDFSDEEKALLTLLRPHMAEIYAGAARRRRGVLTPREWEVLELVAAGLSNAEIAARLFTSVSTIRKHMEHIFDRTGVRSRGAAVARMLPNSTAPVIDFGVVLGG